MLWLRLAHTRHFLLRKLLKCDKIQIMISIPLFYAIAHALIVQLYAHNNSQILKVSVFYYRSKRTLIVESVLLKSIGLNSCSIDTNITPAINIEYRLSHIITVSKSTYSSVYKQVVLYFKSWRYLIVHFIDDWHIERTLL